MDANWKDKRLLLDNVSKEFFEELKEFPEINEARIHNPGEKTVVQAGEKLVQGLASDFVDTLRHQPGEVIKYNDRTYIVGEDGAWRRIK